MQFSRRQFSCGALVLAAATRAGLAREPKKLRVLVVDGINNHTWQIATSAIVEILTDTGLFAVDVSTTPPEGAEAAAWDAWRP
jgi:hypothetical protein